MSRKDWAILTYYSMLGGSFFSLHPVYYITFIHLTPWLPRFLLKWFKFSSALFQFFLADKHTNIQMISSWSQIQWCDSIICGRIYITYIPDKKGIFSKSVSLNTYVTISTSTSFCLSFCLLMSLKTSSISCTK